MSNVPSLGLPLLAAIALAMVHLFAGRVHSIGVLPSRDWLSAGGGAAVAYVFVHILAELGRAHRIVGEPMVARGILDRHIYLVALAGFVVFYGLEHLARRGAPRDSTAVDSRVFWVHVGSFAAYNALIGYLLVHRDQPGPGSLVLFAGAMGLHFLVTDHGLHQHFRARYREMGRWLLSGAILVGWLLGRLIPVTEVQLHALFAFLAGGIILNMIKEELPEHTASRFTPFMAGAIGYSVLLLLI